MTLTTVHRRLLPALRLLAVGAALAWASPRSAWGQVSGEQPRSQVARPVRAHYRVESEGPDAGCLRHRRIQDATSRALGRTVFVSPPASDVAVVLRRTGDFQAEVALFDSDGHSLGARVLQANSCAELTDFVVFTLTVMIDFRSDEVVRKREEAAQAERTALEVRDRSGETDDTNANSPTSNSSKPVAPPIPPVIEASVTPSEPQQPDKRGLATLAPTVGAVFETGQTPNPLVGLFGQVSVYSAAPIVVDVSLRGEHMLETSRLGGQLGAWRAALTAHACAMHVVSEPLAVGACLGLTPSMTWVSARGYGSDRTTAIAGIGLEPTLFLAFPFPGAAQARLAFGGALPMLRNDWHARAADGRRASLFRAAPVGLLVSAGVSFGL